jgi:ankyrin repeat protein
MKKSQSTRMHASGLIDFAKAHRLIKTGNLLALRDALDRGLSPNLSNRFSWTLLMLAAITGNLQIGELLVSRGADLDRTNGGGNTALSLAIHKGHAPFAMMLLKKGASVDCHPHGHPMEEWIEKTSGLPAKKIESLLKLIKRRRLN